MRDELDDRGHAGPSQPEALLALAEDSLVRAARKLSLVIDDVEAGRLEQVADARKATDLLLGFVRLLMEERNKVDKLRKSVAGTVDGGSLDFDAARAEIGRRLACLRTARGG